MVWRLDERKSVKAKGVSKWCREGGGEREGMRRRQKEEELAMGRKEGREGKGRMG